MNNNDILVSRLAEDFIVPLKNYRIARNENQEEGDEFSDMRDIPPYNSLDYWINIVKAKLSVINIIGGFALAKNICDSLLNHNEESEYKLSSAFDCLADGVVDSWFF